MAKQKSGKKSQKGKWQRVEQNRRTYRNVQRRRQRHQSNSPNETESMKHAVRWVSPP